MQIKLMAHDRNTANDRYSIECWTKMNDKERAIVKSHRDAYIVEVKHLNADTEVSFSHAILKDDVFLLARFLQHGALLEENFPPNKTINANDPTWQVDDDFILLAYCLFNNKNQQIICSMYTVIITKYPKDKYFEQRLGEYLCIGMDAIYKKNGAEQDEFGEGDVIDI